MISTIRTRNGLDFISFQLRHHERDGVSNYRRPQRLFNWGSDADKKTHQSCASLAFVWGIHRNSPHKRPVTREMFPFDDVTMGKSVSIAGHHTCHHDISKRKQHTTNPGVYFRGWTAYRSLAEAQSHLDLDKPFVIDEKSSRGIDRSLTGLFFSYSIHHRF